MNVRIDGTGLVFKLLQCVVLIQKAVSGTDFRNDIHGQIFIANPHATYGKAGRELSTFKYLKNMAFTISTKRCQENYALVVKFGQTQG
jgi:hypothetical protein